MYYSVDNGATYVTINQDSYSKPTIVTIDSPSSIKIKAYDTFRPTTKTYVGTTLHGYEISRDCGDDAVIITDSQLLSSTIYIYMSDESIWG